MSSSIIIADAPASTLITHPSILALVKEKGSLMRVKRKLTFRIRPSLSFWNEHRIDLEAAGFKVAWINWHQVNWNKRGRMGK